MFGTRGAILFLVLLGASFAQQKDVDHPIGTPGQVTWSMRDATKLGVADKDTTNAIWIGGTDQLWYYANYDNQDDSLNVTVILDIAPVNEFTRFVQRDTLDAVVVSGTADSTLYKQIASPPTGAFYGRVRTICSTANGDTVLVTTKLTLTRLTGSQL